MTAREQLGLFDRRVAKPTLAERYAAFERENPHVVDRFCEIALDMIRRGVTRWSADAVAHVLRWEALVQTKGDEYRINNSYVRFLSERFVERHPEHADFFERRKRRAA